MTGELFRFGRCSILKAVFDATYSSAMKSPNGVRLMLRGKQLRDFVTIERSIQESETQLARLEERMRALCKPEQAPESTAEIIALRQAIYVLKTRRDTLSGRVKPRN